MTVIKMVESLPKNEVEELSSFGVRFLNPDGNVQSQSEFDFCKLIQDASEAGHGLIPLIGSGLSVPSGVPLIDDLKRYLNRCLALALGLDNNQANPWNPRTHQWPRFSVHMGLSDLEIEERLLFKRKLSSIWPNTLVFQEAIGAIAEWRSLLLFLSRLSCEKRVVKGNLEISFRLLSPLPEVVDCCLRTVMLGRTPNLVHRMLAALGGALRLDLILTTNFDELLEKAFEDANNSLSVFDVHLNGLLPTPLAVSAQRTFNQNARTLLFPACRLLT